MLISLESRPCHSHLVCEVLKLALSCLFARHAIEGMVRQEQLYHQPACLEHPVAAGSHLHSRRYGVGARRHQIPRPCHLHEADTARAGRNEVSGMTQRRYFHPHPFCGLQDGHTQGYAHLLVVDR